MRVAGLVAAAVFALDQATKVWVVHLLDLKSRFAIDVLPPFLNLRMAWNTGVNFGLFSGGSEVLRWGLVALSLAVALGVWLWVRGLPPRGVVQLSAGLLVGGALGNAVDRVLYGAVADFLNMSCCGWRNPWAFNVADIAIFAGAIGLLLFASDDGSGKGAGKAAGRAAGDKTP
jgi:signal peptidase II